MFIKTFRNEKHSLILQFIKHAYFIFIPIKNKYASIELVYKK